ncbi:MAG: hypothetical protein AB7U62_04140 [Pseudolabrys sp.]
MPKAVITMPVRPTPLSRALSVNAVVICDCQQATFKVGLTLNTENGNNFLRILECTACGNQMPVTHCVDSGLAPAMPTKGSIS